MSYDPDHPANSNISPARFLLPFFAMMVVLILAAHEFGVLEGHDLNRDLATPVHLAPAHPGGPADMG